MVVWAFMDENAFPFISVGIDWKKKQRIEENTAARRDNIRLLPSHDAWNDQSDCLLMHSSHKRSVSFIPRLLWYPGRARA